MNEKRSDNNHSRRPVIWGVAGAYLLYLSYDLLSGYFSGAATARKDILVCTIGGGAFLVIGLALLVMAIRQGTLALKAQAAEMERIEAEEQSQARLETAENDEDPQA